jgi:2-iminoacetate synthase
MNDAAAHLENRDPEPVRAALRTRRKGPRELALLLSPGADALLEELAEAAHGATLRHFGRTVQLYAPLYVSNRCVGRCPYCGFRGDQRIARVSLTEAEAIAEAGQLGRLGLRHLLLVAGDAPGDVDPEYLVHVARALKDGRFDSVSVEVAPLDDDGYRALAEGGALDGVTLYQETYDRERYRAVHDGGPKADYDNRLTALDRAGAAGIRGLTAGALWGLAPWREEAFALGLHAERLGRRWWKSRVQIGVPRLKNVPAGFEIPHPVDDRALAHLVVALRLFLEEDGIVLSTREPAALREALLPLGVTQMSAGSRTRPGAYTLGDSGGEQFQVVDERAPSEVAAALRALGYEPIWKDWDRGFSTP